MKYIGYLELETEGAPVGMATSLKPDAWLSSSDNYDQLCKKLAAHTPEPLLIEFNNFWFFSTETGNCIIFNDEATKDFAIGEIIYIDDQTKKESLSLARNSIASQEAIGELEITNDQLEFFDAGQQGITTESNSIALSHKVGHWKALPFTQEIPEQYRIDGAWFTAK